MRRAFLLVLFLAGAAHAAGPRVLATSGVKVGARHALLAVDR